MQLKSRKGFTLAEVLITLGVIGVVAAMTLPGLIQNNQETELTSRAKKAYSQISQAIKLYEAENETPGDIRGLFEAKTMPHLRYNLQKTLQSISAVRRYAKTAQTKAAKVTTIKLHMLHPVQMEMELSLTGIQMVQNHIKRRDSYWNSPVSILLLAANRK